ncbi:MAG: class I SAM-dependent methyltransferase [Ignavibacteria bacterium]|nr:class I SAM-dependent methyltransferase [Ignavibacteria bacterium]
MLKQLKEGYLVENLKINLMNDWFEKWFSSEYYFELYKHREEKDTRTLVNLIQRNIDCSNKSTLLDICCGAGRHSLEFARRGYDVTGFDISPFMISKAKLALKSNKEIGLKIKFLIMDMRNFNFDNSFDIAVNIFSSFGYFTDDDENFSLFQNVKSSLKKNGYFIFDFLNRYYVIKYLVPITKTTLGDKIILQKRRIENNFVFKDIYICKKYQFKECVRRKPDFMERIKLYGFTEIRNELRKNNLEIIEIFGDYYGNKYNELNSKRLIIFAKKV